MSEGSILSKGPDFTGRIAPSKRRGVGAPVPPGEPLVAGLLRLLDFALFTALYMLVVRWRLGMFPTLFLSKRYLMLAFLMGASLWLVQAHRVERYLSLGHAIVRLLSGTFLAGSFLGVIFYMVSPELFQSQYGLYGRSVVILTLGGFVVGGVLVRVVFWRWLGRVARGWRWLLIAGAEDPGVEEFRRAYSKSPADELVFLSDRFLSVGDGMGEAVGSWDEVSERLQQPWTGILLSGHAKIPEQVIREVLHAKIHGMPVMGVVDFCERYWRRVPVAHLHGEWLALSHGFDLLHSPVQVQLKRFMDIVLALGLFLFAAPLMAVIAIAVRLSSKGPVLFRQTRVGWHGEKFTCLKFRTMAEGSETGGRYTAQNDARVTLLGAILRKMRLDELPQLWNVLRGEMSFIGPRAEWDALVAEYENVIPYYHLRHLVRPGLTGWAQVNYSYGANLEDTRMKLEYDFYYIKHYNLFLDMVIVLRTVRVCLLGVGAR